ncbi:MAG: DUF3237 domain-containing protein [Acidimicrobiia bacterium]
MGKRRRLIINDSATVGLDQDPDHCFNGARMDEERLTEVPVEHLVDIHIDFEPAEMFATPVGMRLNLIARAGTVAGERLRGTIVPGSADSIVIGSDGVSRLDVRGTIRTHDGALVFMTNTGRIMLPPDALARYAAGETITSDEMFARSCPLFETSAEGYEWLNTAVTVAYHDVALAHVDYRIYRFV